MNEYARRLNELKDRKHPIPLRGSYGMPNGQNTRPLEEHVTERYGTLAASSVDPESIAAGRKLMIEGALGGHRHAELCGIRVDMSTNLLLPNLNFARAFFEIVVLQPDEKPYWKNTSSVETAVSAIGEDGLPAIYRSVIPHSEIMIPLSLYSTPKVQYPIIDVYNGDVTSAHLRNFDLARDMAAKVDASSKELATSSLGDLGGAFGSFVTTGAIQSRSYHVHSSVNTSNLPSTNVVSLGAGGFRQAVLTEIVKYFSKWGANAFEDGPLTPSGTILVPSSEAHEIASSITWTAAQAGTIADGLTKNGFASIEYLGYRFNIVPDNTLAPGTCYVPANKPLGIIYTKPSLGMEVVNRPGGNVEERSQMQVWGMFIPRHWVVRGMKISYT